MVRFCKTLFGFALLASIGIGQAWAGPIAPSGPVTLTGNVATDFTGTPTNSGNAVGNVNIDQGPGVIAGPTGTTAGTLPSGWFIQDIKFSYDSANDTLYVGVQGYQNTVTGQSAIFGDASGNPNPSLDNNPNMTGDKSIAISFAPIVNTDGTKSAGTPVVIAGIPADKAEAGTGTIDGFTVSKDTNEIGLPQYSFGQQLPQYTGNLAFNPSAAHPELEFTIPNFSQIAGLNGLDGFYVQVYAGSGEDQEGEVNFSSGPIILQEAQTIPEPATWLAWTIVCGAGAAWRIRRARSVRAL